jgi:hypothetical protein
MPYNTRRKSLSLPSLGIHLPTASRAHRSNSKSTPNAEILPPPPKRVKRSHDDDNPTPISSPISKPASPKQEDVDHRPQSRRGPAEHTPPPSPGDVEFVPKIDTDGIKDDIVIAVIEQLEKTGNRPHLIRELATVLAATNDSVAQYVHPLNPLHTCITNASFLLHSSANPAALLSSRLSLYLKRPWTALAPCPLAKELIPVHPRKVFFYLTTSPHQALPENSDDIITPSINDVVKRLTPSVSDASIHEDDIDIDFHDRSRLSPSPEIDLSSHELDNDLPMGPPTPGESFSGRSSLTRDGTVDRRMPRNRAPTPPLEADEKGFTETATAVRARGMSLHELAVKVSIEASEEQGFDDEPVEETPEMTRRKDQELGYELFGHTRMELSVPSQTILTSSPMMQPRHVSGVETVVKKAEIINQQEDVEMGEGSWELDSPENVELDELDGMFSGF